MQDDPVMLEPTQNTATEVRGAASTETCEHHNTATQIQSQTGLEKENIAVPDECNNPETRCSTP